jgi:hypothetical protein
MKLNSQQFTYSSRIDGKVNIIYSQVSVYFLKVGFAANFAVGSVELRSPRVKTDLTVPKIENDAIFFS